jgi:MoaA/NifB/PqqE/SkfB family radical SAM enzyme
VTRAPRLAVLRMVLPLLGKVPLGHILFLARSLRGEMPHLFRRQVRVNSFFPPFPSPAFDRFAASVIARRRVPLSTYLSVAPSCPFACPHCSAAGRGGDAMSADELLRAVEEVKGLGAATIGFTGGEPLLAAGLEDLIRVAGPEMATVVFTSGEGLDPARARSLAGAGLGCLTVGIESADPGEHDRVRGRPGSFDACAGGLRAARDAGIYTAVATVATRAKVASGELDRIHEAAAGWGASELRVLSPVATGGWAGRTEEMLSPEERRAVAEFHVRKNREGRGPAVAAFARLESDALFGCGAGYHHLYIDAAGEASPCDLTPLGFGNVTREPLARIWERMGQHFPRPRRGCLMEGVAKAIGAEVRSGSDLPIPYSRARIICPPFPRGEGRDLPEGYRRLL